MNEQATNETETTPQTARPRLREGLGDNARLRRMLFNSHQHNGSNACLYGDDGELQCGVCHCDFVRDSVDELERKMYEWGMRELMRLGIAKASPNVELTSPPTGTDNEG